MKITALVVGVGIVVLSAESSFAQSPVERGMKVFTAQKCSLCHSIAGKGNPKGPLDAVGTKLTPDQIREWIATPAKMAAAAKSERKPVMKAYPSLPKDDMDALVAYLASLKTSLKTDPKTN